MLKFPVGPILGNLTTHLVDVHEDSRTDRDRSHLKIRHLALEHVYFDKEAQVYEGKSDHVEHGESVYEAFESVQ